MIVRHPLAIALTAGLSLTTCLGTVVGLGVTGATAMPTPHTAQAAQAAQLAPEVETADDLPAGAVVADGPIDGLQRYGDTIYATGSFHRVGRYAGPGAVLSTTTGETVSSATIGDGQVSVVVSDGAGGWYLGGDFTRIGGHPAGGLAHVLADGDVDLDFQPVVNGLVSAVALEGDTLFFGGDFTRVDGTARTNVAAVSVTDGTVLPFDAPQAERVTELAYAPVDGARTARLFVGSDRLVAVDPVTGASVPGFATSDGDVHALLVADDTLYVGGARLRAVGVDTGAAVVGFTSPLPVETNRSVHSLLLSGSTLYVGTDISGDRLVALDAATGVRDTAFAPKAVGSNATFDGPRGVFDLALDGDHLWVGGAFTAMDGERAGGLAVVDATTGDLAGVRVPAYDQQVNAVELSGGQAYVGGTFWTTDWSDSQGVAAFDATTLTPRPGFHAGRFTYGDLMVSSDVVYVADNHFQGYDRSGDALGSGLDYYPYTSRIDRFDPETGAGLGAITVRRMAGATVIGDRLYVAQRLEDDVRFPRNQVLVFNSAGQQVKSFRVPLRGYVTTMETVDGELLLGGSFKRKKQHVYASDTAMLRLDPRSGLRRGYFNPKIDGPVYDVTVSGRHVYATGLFTRVNQRTGGKRPGVVGLSARSRLDTGFEPEGVRGSVLLRLHAVDGLVWNENASTFLDAATGARTADPTGWSDTGGTVQAVTTAPDGIAWSSYLSMNLGGQSYFRLGFLSAPGD